MSTSVLSDAARVDHYRPPAHTGAMVQKRISRASSRRTPRERGAVVRDVFRRWSTDPDDPDVSSLLEGLVEDDPDLTAHQLFGLANTLADELAEATGTTRDQVLGRLLRD